MTTEHRYSPFVPLSEHPELVFGLVAPVGVDMDLLAHALEHALGQVGYRTIVIHLSERLADFLGSRPSADFADEYERVAARMDEGNRFRENHGNDAMAGMAIAAIRAERRAVTGSSLVPADRVAFVLRSLKRPEEVRTLRMVYGPAFSLVAGVAPRQVRIRSLAARIARSRSRTDPKPFLDRAEELAIRDENEIQEDCGQRLHDTFPLADAFVDASIPGRAAEEIRRLVEIVFGHPFHTPTVDEYLMFHAWAASLRSADPSRQVGAVVGTPDGQILAVGSNEVPKAGGGFYWSGGDDDNDHRDFVLGNSASHQSRVDMVRDFLGTLARNGWLSSAFERFSDEQLGELLRALKHAELMNVGEFGRAVHAEMAAITDASRRGVPVQGASIHCTTFPCHNCARHIVATGIREVVYIEPYPKSRALDLHGDAITEERPLPNERLARVVFRPHVGIAPRFYERAFRSGRRLTDDPLPRPVEWSPSDAAPVYGREEGRYPSGYLAREGSVVGANPALAGAEEERRD